MSKLTSVGTKVVGVFKNIGTALLNGLASYGISLAISGIVGAISNLINKSKKAREEAKKTREEFSKLTDEYTEEIKDIDSLSSKYEELSKKLKDSSISTEEYLSVKTQLKELQDQLVETYGYEAAGIDLVNGKYEEQIRLLNEKKKQEASEYLFNTDNGVASKENKNGRTAIEEAARVVNATYGKEVSIPITFDAKTDSVDDFFGFDLTSMLSKYEGISINSDGGGTITLEIDPDINKKKLNDEIVQLSAELAKLGKNEKAQELLDALGTIDFKFDSQEYQEQLENMQKAAQAYLISAMDGNGKTLEDKAKDIVAAYNEAVAEGNAEGIEDAREKWNQLQADIEEFKLTYGDDESLSGGVFNLLIPTIDNMFSDIWDSHLKTSDQKLQELLKNKFITVANEIAQLSEAEKNALMTILQNVDIEALSQEDIAKAIAQAQKYAETHPIEVKVKATEAVDAMVEAKNAISSIDDLWNQAFGEGILKVEDKLTELSEGGTVNLNLRPEIDVSELEAAGWDNVGDGIATVFTSTFSDETQTKYLNFTPIIVDPDTGEYKGVLTPEELTEYAEGVIEGTRTDDLNLQIGTEFSSIQDAETAARLIHNLHDAKHNGETLYADYDHIDVDKIEAVESAFGGLAKEDAKVALALSEFERKLVEFPGDAEVTKGAVYDLITAYVDQTEIIQKLDESNAEWSADQLRAMGITNADAVVQSRLSKQVKKTQEAIAKLAKQVVSYNNVMEDASKTDREKAEALKDLVPYVREALQVYDEDGNKVEQALEIDPQFVQNQIADVEAMAAGDIDALERVRLAAAKNAAMKVSIDVPAEVAEQKISDVMNYAAQADAMDIEIGAFIDDAPFLNALAEMAHHSQATADMISAAFESMGYDVTWEDAPYTKALASYRKGSYMPAGVVDMLTALENTSLNFPQLRIQRTGKGGGGTKATYSAPSSSSASSSSGGGGGGGGGSEPNKPKEESEETFDWIEVAIQRIEEEISRLDKVVGNTYETWGERNKARTKEIKELEKEYEALGIAADEYFRNAEEVKVNGGKGLNDDDYGENDELVKAHDQELLDEANRLWATGEYQRKVLEGQMTGDDIEKIANPFLADTVKEYQEIIQKGIDARDKEYDRFIEMGNQYKGAFDDAKEEYSELIQYITDQADVIDEKINRTEKRGYFVSESYYEDLKTLESQRYAKLNAEYEDLIKKRDEAVASGKIKEGSEAWNQMNQDINAVNLELEKSKTEMVELNNEIRQGRWDRFDWLEDRISRINSEASFLVDLMSNDQLYNENGTMNDLGHATNAMYAVQYETYMRQAHDYAEERKKLEKDLANDPNNKDLIARYEELVDKEQEAIKGAEQVKDSVKSFVEQGIQKFLNKLQELISDYKEALHDAKDFYDYQKNIANQVKNIGNLRKQLLAYEGDDSEETRATVQKLRSQLEDAETQLKETQWDKYISETESFLDDMYTNMEETLMARLDDVDQLMHDMIDVANANADKVQETIAQETSKVGYNLSDTFDKVINGDESRLVTDLNKGFADVNTALTNVQSVIEQIKNFAAAMVDNGKANVDNVPETEGNGTTNGVPQSKGGNGGGDGSGGNNGNNGNNNTNGSGNGDNKGGNDNGKGDSKLTDEDYYGVALAIVNGNYGWGTGEDRFKKLREKGFDDDKVQDIVNQLFEDGYINSGAWVGKYCGITDLSKYAYAKYAKGSKRITHDQMAITQEAGAEMIFRSNDGSLLMPLGTGDKVFTAQMTDNLWELAKGKFTTAVPKSTGGNTINNTNAINITLPNVTNYEQFKTQLQNDPKMTAFIQQITLGEVSNGVKLNKKRY